MKTKVKYVVVDLSDVVSDLETLLVAVKLIFFLLEQIEVLRHGFVR